MEMNNEAKFSCSRSEDMLAYLYDELPPYGRERFEAHLESCIDCIDEFAELAVSRYSVFEWKSIKFAPLPTPRFVVPIERKPATASWFDSVRTAFAWNGWAIAGGTAAAMLFAVVGIALWNAQPDATIATNELVQPNESVPLVNNAERSDGIVEHAKPERAGAKRTAEFKPERAPIRQTSAGRKQLTVAKAATARKVPAVTIETRRRTANERLQNSPTLGRYVEDQDESLRLSDIFDDLDIRELE